MRPLFLGAVLLLAFLPAAGARDEKEKPKPDKPATPAEMEFKALKDQYDKAIEELYKPLNDAKTNEEAEKILEKENIAAKQEKMRAEFVTRAFAFIDKNPKESEAVAEALIWIVQHMDGSADAAKAVDVLIRDHLANRKLDALLPYLVHMPIQSSEKLLRAAVAKAETVERKAKIRLNLARFLKNKAESIETMKTLDEKTLRMVEKRFGKESLASLAAADPAKCSAEAESLFAAVVKDAAEDKTIGATIKETAEAELFELRYLVIGKQAQEIEGEDVQGKKFKLSEYRGKVVVLDFWGNW